MYELGVFIDVKIVELACEIIHLAGSTTWPIKCGHYLSIDFGVFDVLLAVNLGLLCPSDVGSKL